MTLLQKLLYEARTPHEVRLAIETVADSYNLPIVCCDSYTGEMDEVQFSNMEEVYRRYPGFDIVGVECDGKVVKIYD